MRRAGLAPPIVGAFAVLAGAAFLWMVGALPGMVTRNVAAYAVGLLIGFGALRLSRWSWGFPLLLGAASLLLLLTLVGVEADGVRRWIALGPITLQPALIVLPMLLAGIGGEEGRKWLPWLAIPAALIALQPDAASLAALAAAMVAMVRKNDGPRTLAATLLVAALAAIALIGMYTPPPVPFVEGTAATALTSGPAAMALHFAAIVLMAAAPLTRRSLSGLAVAAFFIVCAAIAMVWPFPMPIAGAAPSHLLGFGCAMAILAGKRRSGSEA
jgi:hypothetical protein